MLFAGTIPVSRSPMLARGAIFVTARFVEIGRGGMGLIMRQPVPVSVSERE